MRLPSKLLAWLLPVALAGAMEGCDLLTESTLDREPTDVLLEDGVWRDANLIRSVLANYYDRIPETYGMGNNHGGFAEWDDATWSGGGNGPNTITAYGYGYQTLWDYGLVRDLNLFIEKVGGATGIQESDKAAFRAEARFLRAYLYFEMVRRMGGVPLVTQSFTYSPGDDIAALQLPRATEAEVYDFIAAEVDAIVGDLPDSGSQSRAQRWTALALKARAMLYAGSIARHNAAMDQPITLPGGEVGIPAARADEYFALALDAAEAIIAGGRYSLYRAKADLGENFYEALTSKVNNTEVIWARDFSVQGGKAHNFTYDNIPRSLREDNEAGSQITPTLNLVEAYEFLDGSSGELQTRQEDGDFVYYDRIDDIFANKDARLWGTVIYPGSTFRGRGVQIQAGVMAWNEATQSYDEVTGARGSNFSDGGLLVGLDGPHVSEQDVTNTAFNLRKYLDPLSGSGQRGRGTDMWWVRFRYAEVLLNAAEAALELGQEALALTYVNEVRERAGFGPNSLTSLTLERLQNERRVELAFENHRFWDLKRWRIAHEAWNGDADSPTAQLYALWPYRVSRPGHENDGKYVFVKRVVPRLTVPRFFRLGNYYSEIPGGAIDANPKLVRNPFH